MINGHMIAASVITVLAALQNANCHAAGIYSDHPCSEVTVSGKITKKLFAEGTREVVGLMVELDNGQIAEVEIPKYNDFAVSAGAVAELDRLVKNGPNVKFKAIPVPCDGTMALLDLLP